MLRVNKKLAHLDLCGNKVAVDGERELVSALKEKKTKCQVRIQLHSRPKQSAS